MTTKHSHLTVRMCVIVCLLVGCGAPQAKAQHTTMTAADTIGVERVLNHFEQEIRAQVGWSFGASWATSILRTSSSAARRDSLLNGLEALASQSSDPRVRTFALSVLSSAGEYGAPKRTPGIVARLERIYTRTSTPASQLTIVWKMSQQIERGPAAQFLRSAVSQREREAGAMRTSPEGDGEIQIAALQALARMGNAGRTMLQIMHQTGEVRSAQAKVFLDRLAREGFPVRDEAPGQP